MIDRKIGFFFVLLLLQGLAWGQDVLLVADQAVEVYVQDGGMGVDGLPVEGNDTALGLPAALPTGVGQDNATKPIQYAQFQQLSLQVKMIKARNDRLRSTFLKTATQPTSPQSLQASKALEAKKWLTSLDLYSDNIAFLTPCFVNPCPNSELTLYVQATCAFTAYLIDRKGTVVQTIGTGEGWAYYGFRFRTGCGKFRVRVSSACQCSFCHYLRFVVEQNRRDCFGCQNNPVHAYNPSSCQCECAGAQTCKAPHTWQPFPLCACGCKKELACPKGQYFDRKTCKCKCIDSCCQLTLTDQANRCNC